MIYNLAVAVVELQFSYPGHPNPILVLRIENGMPFSVIDGDEDWLDFGFKPHSYKLGRPVAYVEDPEEWAMSLPPAYANSPMIVAAKPLGSAEAIVSTAYRQAAPQPPSH